MTFMIMLMEDMDIYSNSLLGNVVIFNVIADLLITLLSASILLLTCKRKPRHSKVSPKKLPPPPNLQPKKYPSSEERPSSGTSKPKESTSSQPPPEVPKPKKSKKTPGSSNKDRKPKSPKTYDKFTRPDKSEKYQGIDKWLVLMDGTILILTDEEASKRKRRREDELERRYGTDDKNPKKSKVDPKRNIYTQEYYEKKYGREWAIYKGLVEPFTDTEKLVYANIIKPDQRNYPKVNWNPAFVNKKKKGKKPLPDASKSFTGSEGAATTTEDDDDGKELTITARE